MNDILVRVPAEPSRAEPSRARKGISSKAFLVLTGICAFGCEASDQEVRVVHQRVISHQERVLGFESPLADWATNNGSTVQASEIRSSGSWALGVLPNGYTEINSVPISVQGPARPVLTVDVQLPQAAAWGDVRLVMIIPSRGQYWRDLGGNSLVNLVPGTFHTFSFNVSEDLRSALDSGADDVSLKVIVNAPSSLGQFIFDSLVLDDPGAPSGPEPEQSTLSFDVPISHGAREASITALETLYIAERVEIGVTGARLTMVSGGTSYIGDHSRIGPLISAGDVDLRNNVVGEGQIVSGGHVFEREAVTIPAGAIENASIETRQMTINAPSFGATGGNIAMEPSEVLDLEPGDYGLLSVKSGAKLGLTAGVYTFTQIQIEPQARIKVDENCGTEVFSRDSVFFRGIIEPGGNTSPGLRLVHLGTTDVHVEASFSGSIVAPKAQVYLNSTEHLHEVVAKGVRLQPDSKFRRSVSGLYPAIRALLVESTDVCDGAYCCPSAEEQADLGQQIECLAGGAGSEVLVFPRSADEEKLLAIFAGEGDDELRNPGAGTIAFAGSGNDKICAVSNEPSMVHGGQGDDLILTRGSASIFPGAGRDTVLVKAGVARIFVMDACELSPGETYSLADGATATIESPLSREEMTNLGVLIDARIEVVESAGSRCFSTCAGAPTCGPGETCIDYADAAVCDGDDTVNQSPRWTPSYPGLSQSDSEQLTVYLAQIRLGAHFSKAPPEIRKKRSLFLPALEASTSVSPHAHRKSEVFAIGSMHSPEAMKALVRVALQPTPVHSGGHLESISDWYAGQLSAVQWLGASATHPNQRDLFLPLLLRLVVEGDQFTSEMAFAVYRRIGDATNRAAELQAAVPQDRLYLFDLEFLPSSRP